MTRLSLLIAYIFLMAFLASCKSPTFESAHPDARNSGPFWQREEQRD